MTQDKEKYQQQILFEESTLNTEDDKSLPEPVEQIIIGQDNFEPLADDESIEILQEQTISKSPSRWLLKSGLLLLTVLLFIEASLFFIEGFEKEPFITGLYAALLAVVFLMCSRTIYQEVKGLRALKKRTSTRQSFHELCENNSSKSARALCDKVADKMPCDAKENVLNSWSSSIAEEMTDKEVISLFSKQVLLPADQKVLDKISKYSTEAVVLVSLSPIALVDMGLMFWRNIKMINEISSLYGLQIGYWSRIKLIKQVFVNMVYAGASELIADVGADLVGADLLGKLSARLAQGLGAGMLTARLGLQTMKLCRPIAFEQKEAPKLGTIRKQIVSKIVSLSKKS
ncbi:YcjF family protein [Thalassotalea hakodatensis]|uniref:YcjF family protein n=1 Tax=Thalassotalea hakodatensis TaxID=3030492 RepID=UPI0025724B49|nr:TIGR01620 family protein [Thalassotalea hakodatensis]